MGKYLVGVTMARPQSFNHDQVLESAMQMFWKQGYATTSVKDLTLATKLQPGSLYGAFKNKRNLFINALDYYFERLFERVSNILLSSEPPLHRIRKFYEDLLEISSEDPELKSCLLLNTLLELPPDDEEINLRVTNMFAQIEQLFVEVLIEAQKDGSLAIGAVPQSTAKMLMSGIFGLQVYNRMKKDKDSLSQITNNLLSILEKQ